MELLAALHAEGPNGRTIESLSKLADRTPVPVVVFWEQQEISVPLAPVPFCRDELFAVYTETDARVGEVGIKLTLVSTIAGIDFSAYASTLNESLPDGGPSGGGMLLSGWAEGYIERREGTADARLLR